MTSITREIDVYLELTDIRRRELMYPHVEGHAVRLAFINRVTTCCYADIDFEELVKKQLELYCSGIDGMTFYRVCNEPKHFVRERLLRWDIDHCKETK